MISLSNILKAAQLPESVLEFDFTRAFEDNISNDELKKESQGAESHEQKNTFLDINAETSFQAEEIRKEAVRQAEEVIEKAREEAEIIRQNAMEQGHQEGYDAGYEEGVRKAYEEHEQEMNQQLEELRITIKRTVENVTETKEKIIEEYIDDLKKITLSIAEKVIQTSLKTSGEVIKRMIVSAAGKLKKTQWVKIYVSQKDAGLMMQGDVGLLKELSHISGNVKIISMDHAEEGSCIIELPEEIIDVSVSTQLENIKGILNNARL